MRRTSESAGRCLALILLFLFSLGALITWPVQSVAQKKARPKPSPQPQVQPTPTPNQLEGLVIPLPQIVTRAEELIQQLQEMNDRLTIDPSLSATDQTLSSEEEVIREKQHELEELITITPTRTELENLEQEWLDQKKLYATLSRTLTERAKSVEGDIRFLESKQAEWGALLNQIQDPNAIEMVVERIRNVLNEIQATRIQANELLGVLLTYQDKVSQQSQEVLDALKIISQAKSRLQRRLFDPDSPPIWEETSQRPSNRPADHLVKLSFKRNLARTWEFLKARRYTGLSVLFLFLITLATTFIIHHRIPRWVERHPELETVHHSFNRPISLALLIVLMIILPAMNSSPVQIRTLMIVLFLAPVLRLLAPLIRPSFRPLLYVVAIFGMTAGIWEAFVTSPAWKRWGLIGLGLAVIVIVVWLTHRARCRLQPSDRKPRLVILVIRLSLVLILVSVLANIFGYAGLSRVLRSGTVLSAYSAIVLYTACLVTTHFLSVFFQTRKAGSSSMAGSRGATIVCWLMRLMRCGAFFLWAYMMLNFFTIREPVLGALSSALTTPIRLRAASFTLGDVLTFILVILAGIGIAGVIRVVLREDVLARFNLKRGIPYAVSTITYYLLLLVAFLLALSAAGLELSKFTILTGAIGIGAGFGLQNVINNFVSGIILLFERPIRIGDILEVGNMSGEVVRMGMRSSSISTPQGAEVIVPNSILISTQVVNWTLTEHKRRIELRVKVAHGADPEKVSELLVEAAGSHPNVMDEPGPSVRFLGFGDNSLDFELHFWVSEVRLIQKVNGEVAMKIVHEFHKAGINIPAPRGELCVTGIDASVKEL